MKVIKIDISKEFLDMEPRPSVDFMKLDDCPQQYAKEGAAFTGLPMGAIKETYLWQRVRTRFDDEERNYLVKVDDKNLFQELIQVGNEISFKWELEIRQEAKAEGYMNGRYTGAKNARESIRRLSWWKRLFNKF